MIEYRLGCLESPDHSNYRDAWMLYSRHKLLLALLGNHDGRMGSSDFMKRLFLLTRLQEPPEYSFLPYRYGCFSFQAYSDRRRLIRAGYLQNANGWSLTDKGRAALEGPVADRLDWVMDAGKPYANLKGNDLISYVYRQYPFYAINSTIAEDILSEQDLILVDLARPKSESPAIFFIGYQGRSVDRFFEILLENAVGILVDVRRNAFSMKYGFSRKTLDRISRAMGIRYVHIPALGIDGSKRRELRTQSDYDDLLDDYERTVLPSRQEELDSLRQLVSDQHRIALMCYEEKPQQCHRTRVAIRLGEMAELDPRLI